MEALLANIDRNYLPPDLDGIIGEINSMQGQYGAMGAKIKSITGKNGVLTSADMAKMPPEMKKIIERMRDSIALETAMSQKAYKNASDNVLNLKQLIDKIGSAADPKAIADLSARIQSEQSMIQNDANKLAQATALHSAEQRQIDLILDERSRQMAGNSLSESTVRITAPSR